MIASLATVLALGRRPCGFQRMRGMTNMWYGGAVSERPVRLLLNRRGPSNAQPRIALGDRYRIGRHLGEDGMRWCCSRSMRFEGWGVAR